MKWIWVCFAVVLGVWSCVFWFGRGVVEVDRCLDAGGMWDKDARECLFEPHRE